LNLITLGYGKTMMFTKHVKTSHKND
jgi:hypothetical protein